MDAFESIVSTILRYEGWWVRNSFRVPLTKAEKRKAQKPTMPGYELDILAYKGRSNELLVVECKSYLDSAGVRYAALTGAHRSAKRYKLFTRPRLRKVVEAALIREFVANGSCRANPIIRFGLAAGRIVSENDRSQIKNLFEKRGWCLFDDRWVAQRLSSLSRQAYANNEAVIAAKILNHAQIAGSGGEAGQPG